MDIKERSLIHGQRSRIAQGTFEEADVFLLLMLLRPVAPAGSAAHEIANFIAHREKDRGAIRDYLWRTKQTLDSLGVSSGVLTIRPVYSLNALDLSLSAALRAAGVQPLPTASVGHVLICVLSLLQHVRIVDKGGAAIGELVLARTAAELQLLGKVRIKAGVDAVFPVLLAPNRYLPGPPGDTPAFLPLVQASVAAGELQLTPIPAPGEA